MHYDHVIYLFRVSTEKKAATQRLKRVYSPRDCSEDRGRIEKNERDNMVTLG